LLRPAAKRLPPDQLRQVTLAAALLPEILAPYHQVAELTCGMVRTTVELPVEDNADSDPRAEGNEGKALQVPRCPSPAFTERSEVSVVLDDHRNPKLGLEEIAQRHARPASQIPGGQDHACPGIDQPGDSNPDPEQIRPLLPATGKQRIDGRDQAIDHRLRSDFGGSREHIFRQDGLGRQIPCQHGRLGAADVDAKHDVASRPDRLGACQYQSPTISLIPKAIADRIVTEATWSMLLGRGDRREDQLFRFTSRRGD
jgi:hypothetical protein